MGAGKAGFLVVFFSRARRRNPLAATLAIVLTSSVLLNAEPWRGIWGEASGAGQVIKVTAVEADSAAERAGIRPGDEVIAMKGVTSGRPITLSVPVTLELLESRWPLHVHIMRPGFSQIVLIPGERASPPVQGRFGMGEIPGEADLSLPGVPRTAPSSGPQHSLVPVPDAFSVPVPDAGHVPLPDTFSVPMPDSGYVPVPDTFSVPVPDAGHVPLPDVGHFPVSGEHSTPYPAVPDLVLPEREPETPEGPVYAEPESEAGEFVEEADDWREACGGLGGIRPGLVYFWLSSSGAATERLWLNLDGSYSLHRSSAYSSYAEDGCYQIEGARITFYKVASSALATSPGVTRSTTTTLGSSSARFEVRTLPIELIDGGRGGIRIAGDLYSVATTF